jgi:hypothetical protein
MTTSSLVKKWSLKSRMTWNVFMMMMMKTMKVKLKRKTAKRTTTLESLPKKGILKNRSSRK